MDYKHKDILLGQEATDKIIAGINKLCNAVKVTMGPAGRTVILTDPLGKPYSTKDGVSVANSIKLQDPVENMGCEMAKEAAQATADEAGDGTTTASVLIQALVKAGAEFIENGGSYNEIKAVYSELLPKILQELKVVAKEVSKDVLKDVALISANNDEELSDLIAKAFKFSKIVQVEEGTDSEDSITRVDGVRYPTSYFSKEFVTDTARQSAKLNKPAVLLLDCKLDHLSGLEEVVTHCNQAQVPLVIISEYINRSVLDLLAQNHDSGALQVLPLKTPGYGKYRKEYISDLSIITGATTIKDSHKEIKVKDLGKLESVEATLGETVFLPKPSETIDKHIENLSTYYNEEDLPKYDKRILGDRISNLNAKVAIIKVGGKSELERKERYDRVEDAVHAVTSAKEEGVVQGGGVTLLKIANSYQDTPINNVMLNALRAPFDTMNKNGANITLDLDSKIVDPVKVTRCALENAASIALTILGTSAVVLEERLWN